MHTIKKPRKHLRSKKVVFVALKDYAIESELNEEDIANTIDISEGGALIESKKLIRTLSKIDLVIKIGEYTIKTGGTIIHLHINSSGNIEIGVKFIDLSEADRQIIRDNL